MPNRVPAVRYTAARRSSYARNRACALPSPSPFRYFRHVMAKIVPVAQLAAHAKSSTSYGRTTKFFGLDGLLLFRIVIGLRWSSAITYVTSSQPAGLLIPRPRSLRHAYKLRYKNSEKLPKTLSGNSPKNVYKSRLYVKKLELSIICKANELWFKRVLIYGYCF